MTDRDLDFLQQQRIKHCKEPQYPGGPEQYRYVPEKCVRRRPSARTQKVTSKVRPGAAQVIRDEQASIQSVLRTKVSSRSPTHVTLAQAVLICHPHVLNAFSRHVKARIENKSGASEAKSEPFTATISDVIHKTYVSRKVGNADTFAAIRSDMELIILRHLLHTTSDMMIAFD